MYKVVDFNLSQSVDHVGSIDMALPRPYSLLDLAAVTSALANELFFHLFPYSFDAHVTARDDVKTVVSQQAARLRCGHEGSQPAPRYSCHATRLFLIMFPLVSPTRDVC